jgi:hypothetical protein
MSAFEADRFNHSRTSPESSCWPLVLGRWLFIWNLLKISSFAGQLVLANDQRPTTTLTFSIAYF